MNKTKDLSYRVRWSEDDREYVATCDQYKYLSYLAESPKSALYGLVNLMDEVRKDQSRDRRVDVDMFKEFLKSRNVAL